MQKHVKFYRTKDGATDYLFSFEQQPDGTWRAYIEWQPSYNGRDTNPHTVHRLKDGDRYYVCWDTHLHTLQDAMKVAAFWADCTQEYIRTGKKF